MQISALKPAKGARRPTRRVGRGLGSGRGVYSGRGRKGQRSRSGRPPRPGFEGGQTPLSKRLPFRRGVRAGGAVHTGGAARLRYAPVNLGALNQFPANAEVNPQTLRDAGLVRGTGPVKILGGGTIDRALVVKAQAFSKTAAEAVRKAGGRTEVIA